jgi:hypothetical protein
VSAFEVVVPLRERIVVRIVEVLPPEVAVPLSRAALIGQEKIL